MGCDPSASKNQSMMNLPGFTSLSAAWLFLLLGPLILFYFLKLKRPRMEVPSLALWRQVISDQRVNSPFQRFKRNLLLLLQILLLCALVMGAMQPYWPAGTDRAQAIPVLIDVSASMAALDKPGGTTRLDAAKAEVRRLIDNLLPEQRLCLIAVDSTARRITDFTDNQRVLRDALNGLTVRPVASRLEDGLRMAQALARTAAVQNVVLVSDGNVPAQIDFELPFRLNYQQLPPAGPNVGITEFNARRSKIGWDVLMSLEAAASDSPGPSRLVEVQLLENGVELQRESVSVGDAGPARLSFSIESTAAASLELRIRPDGFDALSLDNQAFLELPEPRTLLVDCPVELATYRHALSALSDLRVYPQEGQPLPSSFDLRITDQPLTSAIPARVTLTTGVVPVELANLVDIETQLVSVVDWNRTAPLLQHVQLLDVQIADNPVSRMGIGERDYELAGYQILAQGAQGPLIVEKSTTSSLEIHLLFHTDRSSLPYRVGFPILVSNVVRIAQQRAELTEARAWPTGILPARAVAPDTEYTIEAPGGRRERGTSSATGLLSGITADEVGRYVWRQGDNVVGSLGTALLSPFESRLQTVEKLLFPETSVETTAERLATDRPLWSWFAMAGFLLLLGEWWYFQRRPGGPA